MAPRRLSCQIFANHSDAETRECKQPLKKHVASPPISISHRLFRCRYSNSRDVVASSTSFFRPAARAPLRAWWKAIHLLLFPVNCSPFLKSYCYVNRCILLLPSILFRDYFRRPRISRRPVDRSSEEVKTHANKLFG